MKFEMAMMRTTTVGCQRQQEWQVGHGQLQCQKHKSPSESRDSNGASVVVVVAKMMMVALLVLSAKGKCCDDDGDHGESVKGNQ